MVNAYDYKVLVDRLKAIGIVIAEEAIEQAIEEVVGWLKESALLSATPYDDILAVAYPMLETQLKAQADKIDGVIGN